MEIPNGSPSFNAAPLTQSVCLFSAKNFYLLGAMNDILKLGSLLP